MCAKTNSNLLLLAMLSLTLLVMLVLPGCAADYTWYRVGNPASSYQWKTVSKDKLYTICNNFPHNIPLKGCTFYSFPNCTIYSQFTEEQAQRIIWGDGMTLADHEIKHCDGWIHQAFNYRR